MQICMSTHHVYLFWLDLALLGGAPLEHHGDRLALIAVAVTKDCRSSLGIYTK